MNTYKKYLEEIRHRKKKGLRPKPIDNGELLTHIINQITDQKNIHRKDSIDFFIYNVSPGTTSAAFVKANFLKEIILKKYIIKEIPTTFAFELLSHMKGGPSVKVLIDLAIGENLKNAQKAKNVLKSQVFLYY